MVLAVVQTIPGRPEQSRTEVKNQEGIGVEEGRWGKAKRRGKPALGGPELSSLRCPVGHLLGLLLETQSPCCQVVQIPCLLS